MRQKYRKGSFRDIQTIHAPLLESSQSPLTHISPYRINQDKENHRIQRSRSTSLSLKNRKSYEKLEDSISVYQKVLSN